MKEKKLSITKQLKLDEWKKRMFHTRVFNEDWQLIHQRRWEDDSPCWEDKCDCEEIYYKKKGMLFSDGLSENVA